MASVAGDLVPLDALPTTERPRDTTADPARGKWYWYTHKGHDGKTYRDLTCVTHVGSNYVALRSVYRSTWRVHFDRFESRTEFEPNAATYIKSQIDKHWARAQELIREVQALTAKLGVAPRAQLGDGAVDETQALAVRSGEPVEAYKKALVKAKKTTLPKLFEAIKEENEHAARWMKAELIPLKAEAEEMKEAIGRIDDRIFSVELYAGLIEEVERIRDGAPAANDEPIHIMQRRHYMDEECLVDYECGGMDFKSLRAFEKWLCKPKHCNRILPFPRTIVAFQIRRHTKHREADSLAGYISMWREEQADKMTFLYFRNGDQVYRLQTGIEFDAKLFPDRDQQVMGEGGLWAEMFADDVKEVVTDTAYQAALEEARIKAKNKEKDEWWPDRELRELEEYEPYDKSSVYYDDVKAFVEDRAKKHNRLVFVVQGLLDRSPVFNPHPPWQLWTSAGFETGVRPHFDADRVLTPGDQPDFEAYRAKLNASLDVGSVTVGQEDVWERREAVKYNRLERHREFHRERHRPGGDPGPGVVAKVVRYSVKSGKVTYEWQRKKRVRGYREHTDDLIGAALTTGEENVLNVDAYTPGDFHIFFDDPRTRAEYLQWAPLLLEAEECHAGKRELKPGPRREPARKPRRHEERPAFEVEKERKPQPSLAEKYRDVQVQLLWSMETKGGTKFKKGEILKATSYYRKELSLQDPRNKERRIRVHVRDVQILGK